MSDRKLERLPEVLFEIGKAIGSDENLGSLLTHISELVTELVSAEACSIMLLDGSRKRLLGKAAHGLRRSDVSRISFRVGDGVAGWVAEHAAPALIDDVAEDERFVSLPDSSSTIRSMACVPLLYRDTLVGVMTTTSSRKAAFSPADCDLLTFLAKTMALDVDNIRLKRLSITDQLTGAFNREFLQSELPKAAELAEKRRQPLSVAMIDVDHFKSVNDEHGHEVGDSVLAEVAQRLRSAIREDDLLVRYGGEEFLVVLPKASSTVAHEISERMRAKLEESAVALSAAAVEIRISIGVAEYRPDDETTADLIRRADAALYAAKHNGRNRVEVAP